METQPHIDVYRIVTDSIIAQLEKHIVPWQKSWVESGHPQNLVTKRNYTGINTWMLAAAGYSQNYFLTWNQLKDLGGSVKKGEKGHVVIFWKYVETHNDDNPQERKPKPVLRYYYVFNIAQCDGLPEVPATPFSPHDFSQISACEEIIARMPLCPAVKHTKQQPYYDPVKDCINMPKPGTFVSSEAYYGTLFHELMHSTGHASRLARKGIMEPAEYGSDPYSLEELVAEIGACYLSSVAGIINEELENSVAYINGWLKKLRNDKRFVILASGLAQRAADYILNMNSSRKGPVMC
ncbi:ArdC family protein [Mucilaginibacter boryungensis]|uniref:DUF1738 domain-containing protein n=1 Tax=Mucilaginibacter boryungensis TaxID=768480 RepID=A0ABR9XLG0_9SPHI|nr:zincin-like metallopeptidase domain-containing protein [Mucilaginibacter boryungensis]MBE9668226.1 DUF1738 domain-containing protein [Mucilaginibacter boryungensis]